MGTLRSHRKGFSLVELMLAMTLSLFLLAGLFASVIGDLSSYESARSLQGLVTKSRMSMSTLRLYLQQTGFRDLEALMSSRQLDSANSAQWNWDVGQRLQGINAAEGVAGAKQGSDIIALRFLGTTASGAVSTNGTDVYDCNGNSVRTHSEHEITLYISTANQLVCQDTATIVLDEGIEHMRIFYGIDDDGSTYKYYSANQVPDWSLVNRVKLALLLSETATANHIPNMNDYRLFDRVISAAQDTNYRQVVHETILVRNKGG